MQAIIKTHNIKLLITDCFGDLKGQRVKDRLRVLDGGEVAQGVWKVKVSCVQNLEVAFRHTRALHLPSSWYCFPLATVSHAHRQNSSLVWSTSFSEFIFHLFCPSFLLLLLTISWKKVWSYYLFSFYFFLPSFTFFLFFFSLSLSLYSLYIITLFPSASALSKGDNIISLNGTCWYFLMFFFEVSQS